MTTLVSSAMAMVMDEIVPELDFSSYSTTTTTTATTPTSDEDCYGCNWNHWSPVVNWDTFRGTCQDGFHNLVDSMMDNVVGLSPACDVMEQEGCNSASTTEEEEEEEEEEAMVLDEQINGDDFKGLRLVHLLMAAAEALTGVNKSLDLARVILVRLKELVSPTEGTNMERLAAYFTQGLQGLLEGAGGAHNIKHFISNGPHHRDEHNQTDMLTAFQLLQDMSPYIKFGQFTANQAIFEAVAHDRRVHIVDFDIMEGCQWASLMEALASRKNGPRSPHLRITALSRSGGGRRSIPTVQETGRRLTAYASSVGQPFSFHQCRLDPDEMFRPSFLKLVRGEALVFNCMLHLPHMNYRAPASVASFLNGAKSLNPRLVTLVEEEVSPIMHSEFVDRFMDSMHHYSAVYDSLEAGFPLQSRARALVERVFLGPRIAGSLGRIYKMGGEEERGSWGEWLGKVGFKGVAMSLTNHCQAKLLLNLFNDGYRVEELSSNKLVLGWKSRRLLSASVWSSSSESEMQII